MLSKSKIFPYESVDLAKTYAEWNSPLLSVDYTYVQTFEDLALAKRKLIEKENEAQFFNAEMKMKWEKLKRRQLDFLEDMQTYDKFFTENEAKCERVSEIIEFECDLQDQYKDEIVSCEKRNDYLSGVIEKMEYSVRQLLPYNEFLISLRNEEENGEKNVENLINHYILLSSQTKLHREFGEILLETETHNSDMERFMQEKKLTRSKLSNTLFHSQEKYERKKNELFKWVKKLDRQSEQSQDKEEEIILMRWSYDNVYRMLETWKSLTYNIPENSTRRIEFIESSINELRRIIREASNLTSKNNNLSCDADSSFMTEKKLI